MEQFHASDTRDTLLSLHMSGVSRDAQPSVDDATQGNLLLHTSNTCFMTLGRQVAREGGREGERMDIVSRRIVLWIKREAAAAAGK